MNQREIVLMVGALETAIALVLAFGLGLTREQAGVIMALVCTFGAIGIRAQILQARRTAYIRDVTIARQLHPAGRDRGLVRRLQAVGDSRR